MNKIIEEIQLNRDKLVKVVLSDTTQLVEYTKVDIRPVILKGELFWQAERYKNNQVFHCNIADDNISSWLSANLGDYKQVSLVLLGINITYFLRNKNKYKRVEAKNNITKAVKQEHNKEKNYILKEGENIPALVDLGVFTKDYKVVKSKYDKYKQINRFIEIVDDIFSRINKEEITILDFGCGKSYLTFIIYYYLVVKKGIKAKIIGYDLKQDVVEDCNKIAKKYGYNDLEFIVSDVTKDKLYEQDVDMVITLHACNTATDYALFNVIKYNVPYLLSVPCCQHEINSSIENGGEMDVLLSHGLIKERLSALLTDAIRAEVLKQCGYDVDIIEFVDFSHSPKNLMIRAKKDKNVSPDLTQVKVLMNKYNFKQTLVELVENKL